MPSARGIDGRTTTAVRLRPERTPPPHGAGPSSSLAIGATGTGVTSRRAWPRRRPRRPAPRERSDPVAWGSAADAWDRIARPFEAAYARYRRAEALLAEGRRRGEATDDLRRAAVVAAGLGAAPLLREIETLATRSRIGLDDRAASPGAAMGSGSPALALTRREMEVLALLADGRTNRQIADALFISESTAGVHVSNILGKLGVTGRTEAAAVAYRSGLVSTGRTDPA